MVFCKFSIYVALYTCIYVYIYIYVCVCMYICIFIYICTDFLCYELQQCITMRLLLHLDMHMFVTTIYFNSTPIITTAFIIVNYYCLHDC